MHPVLGGLSGIAEELRDITSRHVFDVVPYLAAHVFVHVVVQYIIPIRFPHAYDVLVRIIHIKIYTLPCPIASSCSRRVSNATLKSGAFPGAP